MQGDLWRLQAKHETVCPRCLGYIKRGAWIVKEPGNARYSHAVCPKDARERRLEAERRTEPATYEEFNPATGEFETRTVE